MFKTKLKVKYIKGTKDPKMYKLNKILQYDEIIIPIGFKTDLASIPYPLNKILKPFRKYTRSAVLHDFLYSSNRTDRYYDDRKFLEAMKSDEVNLSVRYSFYISVRLFGEGYKV